MVDEQDLSDRRRYGRRTTPFVVAAMVGLSVGLVPDVMSAQASPPTAALSITNFSVDASTCVAVATGSWTNERQKFNQVRVGFIDVTNGDFAVWESFTPSKPLHSGSESATETLSNLHSDTIEPFMQLVKMTATGPTIVAQAIDSAQAAVNSGCFAGPGV